jgi:hypothetical protein
MANRNKKQAAKNQEMQMANNPRMEVDETIEKCGMMYGGKEINRKVLWKVLRTNFGPTISMRLCSKCSQSLFHNKGKLTEIEGGKLRICFDICEYCVGKNIRISDLMAPYNGSNGNGAGSSNKSEEKDEIKE